jgi:hypothetical protein
MPMHKHIIQTAFLALVLAGCEFLGLASDEPKDPVRFDLVLDKTVIAPGDRITVTYTTTNRTDSPIELNTYCSGYAMLGVVKDGSYVAFNGTSLGCRTGLGQYVIEPKESLQFEWGVHAFTLTRETGQPNFDTIMVAPGDYSLRVISNIRNINGKSFSPKPLEVDFKVE